MFTKLVNLDFFNTNIAVEGSEASLNTFLLTCFQATLCVYFQRRR